MQWRKLFDLNPLYAVLSDKIAAREFVASRVGADLLSPLLWTGSTPEQIPFATLDPPYILKCNHGSGYNIIVSDRATLDIAATREKLRSWLVTNYGRFAHEPGYMPVRPQLLAEQMMLEPDGTPPLEFKIFVFDGKPRMIHTIIVDRARERFDAFHDCDWRRLDWRGIHPPFDTELDRPRRLNDFLALAEQLGAGFDHLRVDLYQWRGEPRVGELTLYNWSGLFPLKPDEAEIAAGEWWQLRSPVRRALAAMLS